jgi:hypothetical protein
MISIPKNISPYELERIWKEAVVLFLTLKSSIRKAGGPGEIRTEHFLNTGLKHYHYISRPRISKYCNDQSFNIPFDIYASFGYKITSEAIFMMLQEVNAAISNYLA